jgi:hypothetical protein
MRFNQIRDKYNIYYKQGEWFLYTMEDD